MRIDKSKIDAKWVDYNEEVKLLLRPVPLSILLSDNTTDAAMCRFVYAVEDWQGIYDSDGNKLDCNKDNKEWVFNWLHKLVVFVSNYLDELTVVQEEEIKN